MNIAVINIKDLIKYALIIGVFIIVIVSGTIIVKGKEELKSAEAVSKDNSSFLYCLEMEIPLMANENKEEEVRDNQKQINSTQKILDTQLAMLYNMEDDHTREDEREIEMKEQNEETEIQNEEQNENKKIEIAGEISTQVINENNITASYTDTKNDLQVKNQSKYDIKEILENPNYELKNKDKVLIYHTHTCESYTSSEKYNYEMTGAYRTTDLNYSVAKVRR